MKPEMVTIPESGYLLLLNELEFLRKQRDELQARMTEMVYERRELKEKLERVTGLMEGVRKIALTRAAGIVEDMVVEPTISVEEMFKRAAANIRALR